MCVAIQFQCHVKRWKDAVEREGDIQQNQNLTHTENSSG